MLYLGLWNSLLPVWVMHSAGQQALVTYEVGLALAAALSLPLVAGLRAGRGHLAGLACAIIACAGLARAALAWQGFHLPALLVTDMLAVFGFALLQSLLSLYPAECLPAPSAEHGYRWQKILKAAAKILPAFVVSILLLSHTVAGSIILGGTIAALALLYPAWRLHRAPQQAGFNLRYSRAGLADLRLVFQLPTERFFTISNFLLQLILPALLPLLVPTLMQEAQLPANTLALCLGAHGCGLMSASLSPVLLPRFGLPAPRARYLLHLSILGLALLALGLPPSQASLCANMFVIGLCSTQLSLMAIAQRQLALRAEQRLPIASAQLMLSQVASALSFLVLAWLWQHGRHQSLLPGMGLIILTLIIYALLSGAPWKLLQAGTPGNK